MNREEASEEALKDPKHFYDSRYETGYMEDFTDLYEMCRVRTIREVLQRLKSRGLSAQRVLDYGCGQGRYIEVLREFFPAASIAGSDISNVALEVAERHQPEAQFVLMADEDVPLPDASIDLVISIEVLEHVQSAEKAAAAMSRLLTRDGVLMLTTPCANKYSLEWFYNKARGGLQPSFDGYGRFATDEPGHLRRLNDQHLVALFRQHGVEIFKIYHRAHLLTFFATQFDSLPASLKMQLSMLDWHLFKHLPNGATMLALGRKL